MGFGKVSTARAAGTHPATELRTEQGWSWLECGCEFLRVGRTNGHRTKMLSVF